MTRSINANLLAEQKKLAYTPSLSLSLSDNALPHPAVQDASLAGNSGNPTASCKTSSAIVRAQIQPAAGVYTQKITDPTVASQWESGWTLVDADAYDPAIFWTGTYVVLVYQDAANNVKYRRSSDQGTTWGAATTIWTPAYSLNGRQIGVSGGATRSGLFYANGANICYRNYTSATDAWTGEYSYTHAGTIVSIGAAYEGSNIFRLAVVVEDYAAWTDSALLIQTYTQGIGFYNPTVYIGVQGEGVASYAFNHAHLTRIGSNYWLTYTYSQSKSDGAIYSNADTFIAFSNDGVYFTGGVRLNQSAIADRLQPRSWDTDVYLCCDTVLLKSSPPATVTAATSRVLSYNLLDEGPVAYLDLKLDNRDGTYDTLQTNRLGCDITLERGAVIAGTAYRVARESFIASRFTTAANGKQVHLEAYNYYRLLSLWHAELTYYYAAITLQNLVTTIAALAGIHSVSFDADSVWTTTISEFTIQPGQSAADAIHALQEQYQFITRMSTGSTLDCKVLSDAPSSDYTLAGAQASPPADHQSFFPEDTSTRAAPDITHAQVVGADAGGEANALDIQVETGRQFTRRITREHIVADATAAAAAASIVTKVKDSISRATLYCLPAFHLQPYDAVTAGGVIRYITGMRETYNPTRQEDLPKRASAPWRMTLTLAALVPSSREQGVNTVTPDELRRARPVRKGKIVSFNAATYTAVVRVEDNAATISIPVGHWVSPANLTAGQRIVVLMFDDTNPYDSLVVGSYRGTVTWKQHNRLYASDGSPAPALQTDAAGNLTQADGLYIASDSFRARDSTSGVSLLEDSGNYGLTIEDDGDAVIKLGDAAGARKLTIKDSAGATVATIDSDGKITLAAGASVRELSTDGTLADNSDAAVPTEKATKTYVDAQNLAVVPTVLKHAGGFDTTVNSSNPVNTGVTVGNGEMYLLSFTQEATNFVYYHWLYLVSRNGTASLASLIGGGGGWFSAATNANHQIVISSSSAYNRYCRWSALRIY